ncbi:hypothetical protein JTB14_027753 [Gonioctena quinquepunctata]|nr:hypothetical protein JTB14_027753 [Gonioctena quinquepunctata]
MASDCSAAVICAIKVRRKTCETTKIPWTSFSVEPSKFSIDKIIRQSKKCYKIPTKPCTARTSTKARACDVTKRGCFKCAVCGTKLTLKTYYNNQHRQEDKEVYCNSHVPKIGPGHLDGSSFGIRSALNVPKTSNIVNEQIRGPSRSGFEGEVLNVRTHINGNFQQPHSPTYAAAADRHSSPHYSPNSYQNNYHHPQENSPSYQYGRFDASALHIAHALKQTELQKSYKVSREKPIDCYLGKSGIYALAG